MGNVLPVIFYFIDKQAGVVRVERLLLHKGDSNNVLPTAIAYRSVPRYEYCVSCTVPTLWNSLPEYVRRHYGIQCRNMSDDVMEFTAGICQTTLWNSLPEHVRHEDTLTTFKNLLKTYVFKTAYFHWGMTVTEDTFLWTCILLTILIYYIIFLFHYS